MTSLWPDLGFVVHDTFMVIPCDYLDFKQVVRRFALVAGIMVKKLLGYKRVSGLKMFHQVISSPEAVFNVMLACGIIFVPGWLGAYRFKEAELISMRSDPRQFRTTLINMYGAHLNETMMII